MNKIAIYTLTSELHNEEAVATVTNEFISSLSIDYDWQGNDYTNYGSHPLDLIYVRTGGTEGIFLRLLAELQAKSNKPFYLLTSGKSNSLAASMEILSYLRQQGLKGEIIHGESTYIAQRINTLLKDIDRNGYSGIGKPEPLKHEFSAYWSRRITEEHRLVYRIQGETIIIVSCRKHYE